MWNIRMRASKQAKRNKSATGISAEIHISGAEGMYEEPDVSRICLKLIRRALTHPRGRPDSIVLTVEEIKRTPVKVTLLPIRTLECPSPAAAWELIVQHLMKLGVSGQALKTAFGILNSGKTMRGASLVTVGTGKRREPDRERGVRVSRLGIDKTSEKQLARKLSALHLNNPTVKDAIILASKVASCRDIVAEVCISDDPDYTTGYMASRVFGYLRIPNIKKTGELHGGRVFFVRETFENNKVIDYLERNPVLLECVYE
jgi:6-carboxyhexanoate--CoA ligase